MDRTKAEEILFDLEYWRKVLDDAQSFNEGLKDISENLKRLIPKLSDEFFSTDSLVLEVVTEIQDIIIQKQETLDGLIGLADGRFKYLKGKWEDEKNA